MSKVGIITTHSALNYGAVLQAYALSHYIQTQGIACEVMDYQPAYVYHSYRLISKPKSLSGFALALYQIRHYAARKLRRDKFAEFRKCYLQTSAQKVADSAGLSELANEYDIAICGSDQIWSPELHHFDESYFLSYPDIHTKRVSYAASFGQDYIDETIMPELQRRLNVFEHFACRENGAKHIIESITGKTAILVLDPVFLLDATHWRTMKSIPISNSPYTLCYFLSNPGKTLSAVGKFADLCGQEVYSIGFSPRDIGYKANFRYDLGPLEFLSAINDAETVITNSFHATAFSIIFRKNFFTRLSEGENSRNDRMLTLLGLLGLEDRAFTESTVNQVDFSKPIDYSKVVPKLEHMIQISKSYLSDVFHAL